MPAKLRRGLRGVDRANLPQPRTGAVSGVLAALAFFRDPGFAQKRLAQNGNMVATSLLGQALVFIQGAQAIGDLLAQPDGSEGGGAARERPMDRGHPLVNRQRARSSRPLEGGVPV